MDMVIEEYNDERIQNLANIHYNLILGEFLEIFTSMDSFRRCPGTEMNGHDFGHEFVSESMSEADSETDMGFLKLRSRTRTWTRSLGHSHDFGLSAHPWFK